MTNKMNRRIKKGNSANNTCYFKKGEQYEKNKKLYCIDAECHFVYDGADNYKGKGSICNNAVGI